MSAREAISTQLPMSTRHQRDEWADSIIEALTAAGYRILGPDELDPVTVERCAVTLEGRRSVFMRDGAAVIRALPTGGER